MLPRTPGGGYCLPLLQVGGVGWGKAQISSHSLPKVSELVSCCWNWVSHPCLILAGIPGRLPEHSSKQWNLCFKLNLCYGYGSSLGNERPPVLLWILSSPIAACSGACWGNAQIPGQQVWAGCLLMATLQTEASFWGNRALGREAALGRLAKGALRRTWI